MRVILQIDLILKQVKSYHTPRKKERGKGGDLIETRQEADQKAEDQARTSGARPGKLAGRQTEGGKTLIQSAQLRNSIKSKSDATGFAVGTNVKHAATHQFGEPGRTIRARRKKALHFQVGGKWVSKKQVRIRIPARPFLGLSDDDMQEIKATVEDFIGKEN